MSDSIDRVRMTLASKGLDLTVLELPASARTAKAAAEALGCDVAQIAKSIIFRAEQTGRAVLVVASGVNRVAEGRIAAHLGEPLGKADADFVRTHTGFAIGGVPPVGHLRPLPTFLDEDLFQYDLLWAAAGTPHAVFRLTPDDLVALTQAPVVAVSG